MTTTLILNIALAALVLTAVVGAIAWSITTQNLDSGTAVVRSSRRRRRRTARAQLVGRTLGYRA